VRYRNRSHLSLPGEKTLFRAAGKLNEALWNSPDMVLSTV